MSQRITPSLIIEGIHIPFNGTSNDMSTPNHWSRNTNSSAQVPTEGVCFPFNGTSNNLSTPNHWSRNAYSSPQVPTGGIHIPFNGTSSDMSMPNQWSRNIYSSPQMPIEMDMLNYAQGIHIPFNGTFGDTSTPNSLAGQEIMGTISDQLAPITPERGARVTNHNLSLGPRNVLDGGLNNEKRQDESVPCLVCSATQVNQPINLFSREEVSLSSTAILSTTQLKEVHSLREGEGLQGIDLNKTPQKSRRKKHRPKVVIEGKPQKTPKPVTPQQTIKKEKRKYVRKTPPKEKPVPSAHVGEVDESVGPRDTVRSSCRRFLNFNTEVPVAKGSSVDSGPTVLPVKTDPQFQLQDICEGSQNNILGLPNSNQKLSQGLEVVAETSTAGFAFDLNHSLSQMLGGYFLLPLNPNPSPPIARIDLGKEHTDITGRNRNMKSMPLHLHTATTDCTIIPTILPAPQFVARTQVNSNNNSHLRFANELPLGKGLKRNYCETIGPNHLGSMNLLGANLFSSNANQKINQDDNTHPSSTDKKRRTDVRPNEETTKVSSVMGGAGCDAHTLQTSQSRGLPQCNNMEGKHKLHCISANYLYDGYSHPMTGPYNFIAPNYPHVITFTEAERRPFFNPLQDLEGIVSPVHNETQKKKRSKVPVSVCNLAPITAVTQVKQFPPSDGTKVSLKAQESHSQGKLKIKKQAKKLPTNSAKSLSYYSSNQAGLQGGDVATCNNHQSFTESSDALGQKSFEPTSSSSQSRRAPKLPNHFVHSRKATAAPHSQAHRSVPFNDPIDEIIWRLKSMNISESETSEAQNKLVLYGGDKQMVPHEGPFDPFKKRRPRPKVDLDEETNRVWRLLMWKEGSDEMGGMDAAKEKWWEEERRVFRGRTDSFIARMHLVQGDRRFSRWKGSVVDSVIGVFLTQNVSDHLSSSAFMALAARFPLLPRTNNDRPDPEGTSKSLDEPEVSILDFEKWQEKKLHKGVCNQGFMTLNEAQKTEEKEMASSIESLGSNMGPIGANYSTGKQIAVIDNGSESSRESPRAETPRVPQDMVSSQSSVISSENSTDSKKQIVDQTLSSSESNSEAENTVIGPNSNGYYGCNFTSFMELLNMQGAHEFHEFNDQRNDIDIMPSNDSFEGAEFVMRRSKLGESLASTQPSTCQTKPHYNQTKEGFIEHRGSESYSEAEDTLTGPKSNEYDFGATSFMELLHMQGAHVFQELDTRRNDAVPSNVSFEGAEFEIRRSSLDGSLASSPPSTCQAKPHHIQTKGVFEDNGPVTAVDEVNIVEASADESKSCALSTTSEVAVTKSISCTDKVDRSTVDDGVRCFQNESMSESCAQVRQHLGCLLPESETTSLAEALAQRRNSKQLDQSNLSNYDTVEERLDALESSSLVNKEKVVEQKAVESNKLDELCSSNKESREPSKGGLRSSKRTVTKTAFDWDSLRRQACCNGSPKERSHDAMDSLDYEAVRCADVNEISDSIRARGMNNMLAERMKDFLNRLVRDHGSLDLEWLRDVPPDKAKDYLLSIRGLGLKSVECVRLLTLHHLAFPVDTNVGRICVRLGWVPLQPLPESLQLHLLELYPVLESIQKYLWPRLCKLDQRTLYELHYQMITFGKVFCTKSRPNCNACPMRAECRHFASAFASARLALPGPEEKSLVTSAVPLTNSDRNHKLVTNETSLPLLEKAPHSQAEFGTTRCEPIIEEPASPEPENFDASESAIEDAFWEQDPDEIPTIKLNFKEFSQNLQNYMQENHIQLHDVDMSKALVAITPEAASIPMPKLKNVSRLRTEHLVYELPDSHILLKGLDPREPDDPSPYLLAIWTPGETAQSIQPPEMSCNTSESGNLCDKNTCFACNSIREADAKTVRGTLLIPCRTAMRGSFPLNGTYFQVNEVFADHDSSLQPIDVPRAWIWNLPRRTVYFGTSVPTIFRGLTTEGIQHCFWRGFVCVRGFDQKTRAPRPLMARLHFPASKLARGKKTPNKPPE